MRELICKIFITLPIATFFFMEEWWKVIYGLLIIILIDTILGVWVAIKFKKFTSFSLGRKASSKMVRYALGLATVYCLAVADPVIFGWAFNYVGIFFIVAEVISNFEKLSLLGMALPTNFLAKINEDFRELKHDRSIAEDIVDENINK